MIMGVFDVFRCLHHSVEQFYGANDDRYKRVTQSLPSLNLIDYSSILSFLGKVRPQRVRRTNTMTIVPPTVSTVMLGSPSIMS